MHRALSLDALPLRMDPRLSVIGRQRITPKQMVADLFAHHDRGRIQIAIGDARKDRTIRDAQPLYPDHTGFGVNHGHRVIQSPHLQVPQG